LQYTLCINNNHQTYQTPVIDIYASEWNTHCINSFHRPKMMVLTKYPLQRNHSHSFIKYSSTNSNHQQTTKTMNKYSLQ
jgi:hypothetical protein